MKDIVVARPFNLTGDGGERVQLTVGVHKVEDWVADHWYTQHHLQPKAIEPTDPGLLQAADGTPLAADVGVLSAALATERDITNKLKIEVGRLSGEISGLYDRATKAEAALAEHLSGTASTATPTVVPQAAPAPALVAGVPATPAPAQDAAPQALEADEDTSEEDVAHGNYVIRKKGRYFQVLQVNDAGAATNTVAEGLTRNQAEAKVAELKAS